MQGVIRSVKCILLCLFAAASPAALAEQTAIKIGAVVSLTGPAAEQGKNWLQGAELATEELRAKGINVQLIVEDDATLPAKSALALQKLANVDKVSGVVGGTWDFLAEAAGPLVEKYRIPFITPTNPVEILSPAVQHNKYFFTNGLSLKATSAALREVLQALKPTRAALVVPNVPFGIAHADLVERLARELGIEIVMREQFDYAGYHDTLRVLALKLSRTKPELVFCLTDYSALVDFMRELTLNKYEPWLLTTQHLDEAVRLSKTPALWKKAIGIYPDIQDRAFAARFEKKFGHAPKVYSAEGYDALQFLANAAAAKVNLTSQVFELEGVTGRFGTGSGRDISATKAVAMSATSQGTLVPFSAKLQNHS